MTDLGKSEPNDGRSKKPPNRNWEATRKERFFDLKFSHYIELILTAILVCVGWLQYKVYTRQAGIMDQQTQIAQAEHRPWVSASLFSIVGEVSHNEAGLKFLVVFKLKNTGHSPARHVAVSIKSSLKNFDGTIRRNNCEPAEANGVGIAIFPNDETQQGLWITVPEADFVEQRRVVDEAHPGEKQPLIISPQVAVCIAYQDMEIGRFHHTFYDFIVSQNVQGPLRPFDGPIIERGGSMRGDQLLLYQLPFSPPPD